MSQEILTASEETTRWARFHFRKSPKILESLTWLNSNPEIRENIATTFNSVVSRINLFLENPHGARTGYTSVNKLKNMLPERSLPTIGDLVLESRIDPNIASNVQNTFRHVAANFLLPDEINTPNPSSPASIILLEGFGQFIGGVLYGSDSKDLAVETQKTFVKAFQEVLITNHPDSSLFHDVKLSMKKNASQFSETIQHLIVERT